MSDPTQAAMIEAMAAKRLGPPTAAPKPETKETRHEVAATEGAPETEGDRMDAEAIIYDVDFGDGDIRKLTPAQIAGTFNRYRSLNHQNAAMKPIHDAVAQIARANPKLSATDIAKTLIDRAKEGGAPSTFGNDAPKGGNRAEPVASNADIAAQLREWEENNAASLPPGYADMLQANTNASASQQAMLAKMSQMERVLAQVLAGTEGVANAARDAHSQGQNARIEAIQKNIWNNIDRVQMALQLPDDKAEDFMVYAGERGYTLDDFADQNLTYKVMSDFKNAMNSPEMERLRAMSQRRQAYTGSLGSTPSSSPAGGNPADGANSRFERFVDAKMAQR